MSNTNILLKRAEEQFLKREYSNAMKIYSLILKDDPKLKDAKVGVYLSDMGLDSDEDAQALFSYYQAIKDSSEDAEEIIDQLMQSIYSAKVVIQQELFDVLDEAEMEDGIRYSDFMNLVKDKGSFKEAFEDILFSTRVILHSKDEFIDFIKRLVNEGYNDMALKYLDALADNFSNDQSIYSLYELATKDKRS